jgi:hypothetical protein
MFNFVKKLLDILTAVSRISTNQIKVKTALFLSLILIKGCPSDREREEIPYTTSLQFHMIIDNSLC